MNKTFFIVSVLLLLTVGAKAQTVTTDIKITEEGFPIIFGVAVTCDGLDSVFSVEPDSTGHFRMVVPRGRCVISALMLDDVCLDLQSDTSIALDLIVTPWPMHRDGYRSRREKDSTLHAREAALKADLYGTDTNRWPHRPNYATLAQMMEDDLFYRLPRWRTYSMDTVLYYLKFCYFCDRNEYDYLYYTIRQMERRMGLEPDLRVKPPRKPDGRWYCPMPEVPENWMDDTATDYGDLIARAREESRWRAQSLEPMGEKSLVYPKRKGLAFRMVMYGGLSTPTSVRVEKGRFYYRCREYTWDGEPPKRVDEALDFALTKAELDTMARCIAALDTLTTNLVGDWPGIDGPEFYFEWVKDGNYRSVICYHPGKEEPIKTLYDYLIRLRLRHLCKVSFYLEDEFPEHKYFSAESYTRGRRWLSSREAHRWKGEPTTHYVPKGKYTLSVEKPGYETIERPLDVKGDVMLDTLRMRHKRITLRLQLQTESGWPLTGPIGMYVDGVDSVIVGDFDPIGQTVVFHDVPAACDYYLVEHVGRSGGWYHSQVSFVRTWTETDTLMMRLDRSREDFSSRSRKDIHLNGIVRNRRLSGGNHDLELGELYYYDALLEDIPTWQTFPKADSLAYDCLRRVYHSDPQQYGYLYYPIQHLVWKNWDLKNDSTIHKPEVDSTCYVPLPEELWEKKHYVDYDLLTPFREAQEESDSYRRHLATMQEPSLVFPQRVRPSFRWIGFSPVSGSTEIVRIDGDTLYVKEMFNTRDLYDAADISQEWPDTVVVRMQALSTADQDVLRRRLEVLAAEGYKGMVGPGPMPGCTDQGTAVFEYVLEGRYHRFEALYPDKMAAVKALMDWIEELKKEE